MTTSFSANQNAKVRPHSPERIRVEFIYSHLLYKNAE